MPKIFLYAEILTHIKQLTLHASLQSEKYESLHLDISSDKKMVTVEHDGESSRIYLPTQISGTANITFMTEKKTELSARLQIEDLHEWKQPDPTGIESPWTASELTSETAVRCKHCEAQIFPLGCISSWKDLPNQDWADVMDLWYCHKPHEDHDSEEQTRAAQVRGTAATSKLASVQGTGMIDLISFVLHPGDCQNVKIPDRDNEINFKPRVVKCSACGSVLGSFTSSENLVRLYKSDLAVTTTLGQDYISHPASTFIGAQLLSLIESTPVRKIMVYSSTPADSDSQPLPSPPSPLSSPLSSPSNETRPMSDDSTLEPRTSTAAALSSSDSQPQSSENRFTNIASHPSNPQSKAPTSPLLLWIFNPNIYYASSSHPSPNLPHRAQKIFYKSLPALPSPSQSQTHEHLDLPTNSALSSLHETLKTSTAMLPASARRFEDWEVGLLDRWERVGTAVDVMEENPLARRVEGERGDGRVTRWSLPEGWRELYL